MDNKAYWEKIYKDRSPLEVSWYQKEPIESLNMILKSGISKDAAILDVGGGASTLVDVLLSQHYSDLSVLDLSKTALNHAKARLGNQACGVTWIESDATAFTPSHQYDLWHDRAVLHFLTDPEDQKRYIATLKNALGPYGQLIIAAFNRNGPKQCSGLDIVQHDTETLCHILGFEFTLVEETTEIHTTPNGTAQSFGFYRFVRG